MLHRRPQAAGRTVGSPSRGAPAATSWSLRHGARASPPEGDAGRRPRPRWSSRSHPQAVAVPPVARRHRAAQPSSHRRSGRQTGRQTPPGPRRGGPRGGRQGLVRHCSTTAASSARVTTRSVRAPSSHGTSGASAAWAVTTAARHCPSWSGIALLWSPRRPPSGNGIRASPASAVSHLCKGTGRTAHREMDPTHGTGHLVARTPRVGPSRTSGGRGRCGSGRKRSGGRRRRPSAW